tara:strand:- start:304 stop:609 length:306 start_codon:yes stop_codon:yes gene_type:complete
MTLIGYNKRTFSDNFNHETRFKNGSIYKERIVLQKTDKDGNMEALVKEYDNNMEKPLEYYVKKRNNLNDILVDNTVNQLFAGGVTVLGLYVLWNLLKRSKY